MTMASVILFVWMVCDKKVCEEKEEEMKQKKQ